MASRLGAAQQSIWRPSGNSAGSACEPEGDTEKMGANMIRWTESELVTDSQQEEPGK